MLTGRFDNSKEAYVFSTHEGTPAYHVTYAIPLNDGRVLLVDRGMVPEACAIRKGGRR